MDTNHRVPDHDLSNRLSHTESPTPFPVPVELLHKIVLIYLAASFWDLIAEPGLEKNWDPLSPLLHTSVLFRDVTTDILRNIIGPPFVDTQARDAIKYHGALGELKRLKTLAEAGDPKQLLDPELGELATALLPLTAADSPILWRAGELSVTTLRLRLYECHENVTPDVISRIDETVTQWLLFQAIKCSVTPSDSVVRAILRPLQGKTMAGKQLVQKLYGLATLCREMERLLFILAGASTEIMLEKEPALNEVLAKTAKSNADIDKRMQLALQFGFDVPVLHIPDAVLETIRFYKVLYAARIAEDWSHDDPFVRFCLRIRELLFSYLREDQKETALKRVEQLRAEAEAPIDWDDVDDFIYNYTDSGSDDEGLDLD